MVRTGEEIRRKELYIQVKHKHNNVKLGMVITGVWNSSIDRLFYRRNPQTYKYITDYYIHKVNSRLAVGSKFISGYCYYMISYMRIM